MGIWIIWLIVAAALGVAELVTMTLALGLIAVGAVAAAGVGAAGGNEALQFGAQMPTLSPASIPAASSPMATASTSASSCW